MLMGWLHATRHTFEIPVHTYELIAALDELVLYLRGRGWLDTSRASLIAKLHATGMVVSTQYLQPTRT